ncbi:MAG TPA: alpha/beta hydrolase [Candidatus Limnocylindrales bacterium]|nr:alpha/beta hydrolase [Candidatus Limnocylindrales bacterium]
MTDLSGVETPEHIEHRIELPDGRILAVAEWGDPSGIPCFSVHGTPGGRITYWKDPGIYARYGLRRFTIDRAGYGESTRNPGRSVADFVGDILAAADALAAERFVMAGGSGGGPHVLAVAALAPERVIRVMASVSVAPFDAEGLDWLAGQTEGNVREFEAALAGEDPLRELLVGLRAEMFARFEANRADWMGDDYVLSDADREQLAKHLSRIKDQVMNALAHGVDGWVDDNLALTRPWGFDVSAIRVPVVLEYGRTDVLVPPAHGDWLAANVPGAEAWVDEAAGHLGDDDDVDRDMTWLATGRAPG